MNAQDELIERLSRDLKPVSAAPNTNTLGMVWLVFSAIYVVAMTFLAGPNRPGALSQLFSEPRFLIETMLGALAIMWMALVAFRAAVPSLLGRKFAAAGVALMSLWLLQYVYGLVDPALEPSTLGERSRCYLEVLIHALPPALVALFFIRRLYPLNFIRTSMAAGLAAGMIPALYMQLACAYEPVHILTLHILPGLCVVLVAAAVAAVWRLPGRTRNARQ